MIDGLNHTLLTYACMLILATAPSSSAALSSSCLNSTLFFATVAAGMMDAAKVADLVLLMIDGSFGLEMETFEFLNLLQVRHVMLLCYDHVIM
jgi:hypothetical protein